MRSLSGHAIGIPGLTSAIQVRERGGVELRTQLLATHLQNRGAFVFDPLLESPLNSGSRALIYVQTQGYLNASLQKNIGLWLSRDWTVVEHNVFGLASRFRKPHENYFMACSSRDSALRCRFRQSLISGKFGLPQTMILPPPLRKDFSKELSVSPKSDTKFLRVGRPDKRKWTHFELDFVKALAMSEPEELFELTLVGFPFDTHWRLPGNMTVRVLPYQDEMFEIFELHSHYLHHSAMGETFGNTIREAKAAGLSLILSLDPFQDSGFVDYLLPGEAVIGTPIGLYEQPARAYRESKRLWTEAQPGLPLKTHDSFIDALLSPIAENFDSPASDLNSHLGYLASRIEFGAPPRNPAVLAREAARGLKALAKCDP